MSTNWKSHLERWVAAGVVDTATADRIGHWESEQARSTGLRWPIVLALAFGALLLAAGVLLFVSAHWDGLSPSQRMSLVVAMVGAFHAGGAMAARRFRALSVALHTVGTIALGGGIALAGQIFHLSEHWPAAILIWAIGSIAAWALLNHWTQAALTAILVPYWLAGEWWVRMIESRSYVMLPVAAGVCALSFAYLGARRGPSDGAVRKALGWIGGLVLLPAAFATAVDPWRSAPDWQTQAVAWLIATAGPLLVAALLRRRDAIWIGLAIVWTVLLAAATGGDGDRILVYLWCVLGSVGLAAWGIREARSERINLAVAGFAITVLCFYFSSVMDKLGRSASLIVIGLLFLGGGWLLEQTRRRLIARIRPEVI